MSRLWLRRCPACDALVSPEGAEQAECRNGHTFATDDAFALTTCEGCGPSGVDASRSIPGVRFPTATNSDDSREWIERCDSCEEFESDEDAADALVKAGRINGWRWDVPVGCEGQQPYAVAEDVAAI